MYLNQSFNSFFQHPSERSYMRKAGASARISWLGGGQRPLDRGIGLRSPGKPDELGKSGGDGSQIPVVGSGKFSGSSCV